MSADIMALYGPGSRIDGFTLSRRNVPPPSDRRVRLEAGLERLHALFLEMAAKWVDALDAETADADLEPSLAMREHPTHGFTLPKSFYDRAAGSTDDREADGLYYKGPGDADFEPSLGSPEPATPLTVVYFQTSRLKRQRIRVVRELGLDQTDWGRGRGDEEQEPSLAMPDGAQAGIDRRLRYSPHINEGVRDADLEEQCDDGEHKDSDFEPDADDEPSLAAPEQCQDYALAQGAVHHVADAEFNGDEGRA